MVVAHLHFDSASRPGSAAADSPLRWTVLKVETSLLTVQHCCGRGEVCCIDSLICMTSSLKLLNCDIK